MTSLRCAAILVLITGTTSCASNPKVQELGSAATPHSEQGHVGNYGSTTPSTTGSMELAADGQFRLRLPSGLLNMEEGEFSAGGRWRASENEWPGMSTLTPVVTLVVAEWGGESHDPPVEMPLYEMSGGLALTSPCMTWTFERQGR